MPFATSEGLNIYYERHGNGPAVVLVHGTGGHHAAWWQQVPDLVDRYTVITLDLEGFGKSDSSAAEFDALRYPGQIHAVLDANDVDRCVIVGQSAGSVWALRAVMAQPGRFAGVVLGCSTGGIDHPELGELAAADRSANEHIPIRDRLLSQAFRNENPPLSFLFDEMTTFNSARMTNLSNVRSGGPTLGEVKSLTSTQVCFLAAERDAMTRPTTVQRAHELLPSSAFDVVSGAPHSVYWEMPAAYNAALGRFLEESWAQ